MYPNKHQLQESKKVKPGSGDTCFNLRTQEEEAGSFEMGSSFLSSRTARATRETCF